MLIKKEIYLSLLALFVMGGVRAGQGDDKNLPKTEDSWTVLKAANNEDYSKLSDLLDKESINLSKEHVNRLFSMLAYSDAPKEVLEKLFKKHSKMVELNKGDEESGNTIFIYAAMSGNIDYLKLIKQYFPAVNLVNQMNKLKQTGFIHACSCGKVEVVKYLIGLGAKIHHIDQFGYTGFMRASQRGKINVVKYLLEEQKIKLNKKINELQMSIDLAIKFDHDEVVGYLLEKFQSQFSRKKINSIAQNIAQCGASKVMEALLNINQFEKQLTFGGKYTLDDMVNHKKTFLGDLN